MSFFGELRRRNAFRVGIAYLAVIWVLIQVADTVLPVVNAPTWILQALVFSSALGFPLAAARRRPRLVPTWCQLGANLVPKLPP